MGEGVHSLLWDGVVLGVSICPYCNGFPEGKRHYDCKKLGYCGEMNSDSFQIPKDKGKIQTFLTEYQGGKDFFEIAKLMWEEKDPEKIAEKARSCKDKIRVLHDIGDMMMTKLSAEDKTHEEYMKDKIEELRKML
jgi:hypothetical protein